MSSKVAAKRGSRISASRNRWPGSFQCGPSLSATNGLDLAASRITGTGSAGMAGRAERVVSDPDADAATEASVNVTTARLTRSMSGSLQCVARRHADVDDETRDDRLE